MIHHVSIPVADPRRAAEVFAELFDGRVTPFKAYEGGWIAWTDDEVGTSVEFFPVGTEMFPPEGEGMVEFRHVAGASPFVATHLTLTVERTVDEVLAIADREGWRAKVVSRGPNDVIEFWVENSVMVEVMTSEMAADFLSEVRPR
jgi:catechol 2,3-dioxygenase-like lactoylglutathione lyase family enzyme